MIGEVVYKVKEINKEIETMQRSCLSLEPKLQCTLLILQKERAYLTSNFFFIGPVFN